MSSPIVNPEIPFNDNIPGGLQPGKMCRVQGVTHPNTDRFSINFQTGPNAKPRDDTALHISVRLNQGYIARNSYKDGVWGDEQGNGILPIGPAQAFEILLLVEPKEYKIAINGQHFCEFPHRIPFSDVSHLLIDGDVSITLISWEAATGVVSEIASHAPQLNTEGPLTSSQQIGRPQENYGPLPQGYPPQGPYGPAPIGYGPPIPPGAQPESGFDSFLEQAQSVLASAIKSGAAEKLLSGLLSTGGQQNQPQGPGYVPQNAQYGIYPQLPQDDYTHQQKPQSQGIDLGSLLTGLLSTGDAQQDRNKPQNYGGDSSQYPISSHQQINQNKQNESTDISDVLANLIAGKGNDLQQGQSQSNIPQGGQMQQQYGQYPPPPSHPQEQRGPFESLLSGLLSSGSNQQQHQVNQQQQQPQIPQIGGEGSIGGLGSMGGILSNLAGKILHNPKDANQHQN